MKKIGFIFTLVALLLLNCAIASAKKCVKWETEVYECGTTWAPADGDPLTKGPWYPVPLWCERQVCVEWAKSDQPSEKMFASDDDCNCTCAECGWKCGTGHATSCSSYQKPKAKSDMTSKSLLCSLSYAAEERETVTATGELIQIVAIGGETTGWAIKVDEPLKVKGEKLDVIEIDMMGKKINLFAFVGDKVKVIGNLVKRHGVERGDYWVIEVKELHW